VTTRCSPSAVRSKPYSKQRAEPLTPRLKPPGDRDRDRIPSPDMLFQVFFSRTIRKI
jgi:hypothetical protein